MESGADVSWQQRAAGAGGATLVRQPSPSPAATAGAYLNRRATPTSGTAWAASADPFYPAAAYGTPASSTGASTTHGHYLHVEMDAASSTSLSHDGAWGVPRLTSPPPAVVPSPSTAATGPTAMDLWAMATLQAAGGADRDFAAYAALQFQAAAAAAAAVYQDAASMGYHGGGTGRGQRAYHGAIPMINIDEAGSGDTVPLAPRSRPSSVELVQSSMNTALWAQYYAASNSHTASGYGIGGSDAQSLPTSPTGMLNGYGEVPARMPGQAMSPPHQRPISRTAGASSPNAQTAAAAAALPADDPKRTSLYKTELCRSFEESGFCRYGAKCQFAHGQAELRVVSRHPRYKTEICKTFHTIGTCPYGRRCRFIHNETTLGATTVSAGPAASVVPAGTGARYHLGAAELGSDMDQSEVIDLYFASLKETDTGSATSTALLSPSAISTDLITRARRQATSPHGHDVSSNAMMASADPRRARSHSPVGDRVGLYQGELDAEAAAAAVPAMPARRLPIFRNLDPTAPADT